MKSIFSVRLFILFVLFTASSSALLSQQSDAVRYPTFKFDGNLKTKFEYAPETGNSRFSVRNSRLGLSGKITPMADYRAQVELSKEGKFEVLDLSGTLTPYEGLSFTLGQTSIPLFNSYIINPGTMMFANRSFLGKYYVGTRDIGLLAKYSFRLATIPAGIELGVYNGNTINNPVWTDKLSCAARLSLGGMKGFRTTFKLYDYPQSEEIHYFLYGADFRYEGDNWKVETEAMKRDDKVANKDLFSAYIQGAYWTPIKGGMFKNIIPAARWDAIDQNNGDSGFDVNRLTLGLGFGLTPNANGSLLRINYEWYFIKNQLDFMHQTEEMDADKFTVELVYVF